MASYSTYLDLTNAVLRRINEVELTSSNFNTARGMQAVAKDCVKDAIREVNQQKWSWPWSNTVATGSQTLQVGVSLYSWPTSPELSTVDWNSFYLEKDSATDMDSRHLKPINRDEWYQKYRDQDYDNAEFGIGPPKFIFRDQGQVFGVSPVPNKEYKLKFNYYINQTLPEVYNDNIPIPNEWDNVIIHGALYHLNLFRENIEGSGYMKDIFFKGISNMYVKLLNNTAESMNDTRVKFGGNIVKSSLETYHL